MDDKNAQKHSIKNQRVKGFFIEAAKKIILQEGVESVSVRKVAELAGYSYATIYNYFTDLNALLLEVKASMIGDVAAYMGGTQGDEICDIDGIKELNHKYAQYYLTHPHVFRFFYSYRFTGEPIAADNQPLDYSASWYHTYRGFVMDGTIREPDVEIVAKTIIYTLHGVLALYFSDNGLTKEILFHELDQAADYLLKRRELL